MSTSSNTSCNTTPPGEGPDGSMTFDAMPDPVDTTIEELARLLAQKEANDAGEVTVTKTAAPSDEADAWDEVPARPPFLPPEIFKLVVA